MAGGTKGKTSHKNSPGERIQAEARTTKRKDKRVETSSHGKFKTRDALVAHSKKVGHGGGKAGPRRAAAQKAQLVKANAEKKEVAKVAASAGVTIEKATEAVASRPKSASQMTAEEMRAERATAPTGG